MADEPPDNVVDLFPAAEGEEDTLRGMTQAYRELRKVSDAARAAVPRARAGAEHGMALLQKSVVLAKETEDAADLAWAELVASYAIDT